jgi:hypothetical protein
MQQALRHLDTAFPQFFEGHARYPTFKKKHGRQAATHASSAFRWDAEAKTLTLAKMDAPLDIHWSRSFADRKGLSPAARRAVATAAVRRSSAFARSSAPCAASVLVVS